MKKDDKSNLVDEAEEEHNESNENGFVGDRETPAKSTTVRLCGNWKLEGLTLVILVVVIFSVAVTVAMVIHILVGPPQVVPHGAAASMSSLCSKAAVDVMHHHGGNGVDGAVAAAICESVTLAHRTGLGAGALMFVYSQTGRNATIYNCREAAPSASSSDMFKGKYAQSITGGLSVGVPGFLRCLYTAHKKFGKAAWETVVKPSIKIANDGFPMPSDLHAKLKSDEKLLNKVKGSSVLSGIYLTGNKSVASGTTIKRPNYAKVLEKVANKGDAILYSGEIATEIVDVVKKNSGIMKKGDLSSYKAKTADPLRGHFNHFNILTFPLPSIGGPLLISSLNSLEAYGIYKSLLPNETEATKPNLVKAPNPLYYQRLAEILRRNLHEVRNLGAGSNSSAVSALISPAAAKKLIGSIHANASATLTDIGETPISKLDPGDSHLTVEGPDNTIVSISSSLGAIFGSGVVTTSEVVLNNAMGAFSSPDKTPVNSNNLPGPNKQPPTPLSPFVAHNPRRRCGVRFGAGSTGGLVAPQASVQMAVAALLWDVPKCREKDCLNLELAIQRPRLAVLQNSNTVQVEAGIPQKAINFLKSSNHTVVAIKGHLGGVQAAGEVQHSVTAFSDSRLRGKASEY